MHPPKEKKEYIYEGDAAYMPYSFPANDTKKNQKISVIISSKYCYQTMQLWEHMTTM